ncbi:MAG: DUF1573 domain-containing protein [Bacteroidales bacterium]|nr:DUF1573 domain-containing protein [Bacteroidales bacterium]
MNACFHCISLVEIVFAFFLTSVHAERVLPFVTKAPAKLHFVDKRIVDYGEILQGEIADIAIRFTNVGEEDLVIYDIIKTCNCTDVAVDKKVLPPGDEDSVAIHVSTKGKLGPQTVVLKLLTNGENEYYIIRVNLNVLKP